METRNRKKTWPENSVYKTLKAKIILVLTKEMRLCPTQNRELGGEITLSLLFCMDRDVLANGTGTKETGRQSVKEDEETVYL